VGVQEEKCMGARRRSQPLFIHLFKSCGLLDVVIEVKQRLKIMVSFICCNAQYLLANSPLYKFTGSLNLTPKS